jgi:hypothetical protein
MKQLGDFTQGEVGKTVYHQAAGRSRWQTKRYVNTFGFERALVASPMEQRRVDRPTKLGAV